MRIKILKTSSLLISMIAPVQLNAQVTTLGNGPGAPGEYLGWNNATAIPLQIRHNANQPINFFTNNLQRMSITPAGRVGIGDPVVQQGLLHLYQNVNAAVLAKFSNLNTGTAFTDGAEIGVLNTEIKVYIDYYNKVRTKSNLNKMSPIEYRTHNCQINY